MHDKLEEISAMLRRFQKGFPTSTLTPENVVYYAEELTPYDVSQVSRVFHDLKLQGLDFFPSLSRIVSEIERVSRCSNAIDEIPEDKKQELIAKERVRSQKYIQELMQLQEKRPE